MVAAVVILAAAAGAAIALSSGGSSGSAKPKFVAQIRPVPTNRVTGTGSASVTLQGNTATVTVDTNGLLAAPHLMHIHGGTGNCPPASAATSFNGHQFISAAVGDRFYGGVVASLTQHGDTSPQSHTISSLYPSASNIHYTRPITLSPAVASEIRQGLAVIVVHGIDYNGNGSYDNSLGAGAEAAAPGLCGQLFPTQTASTGRSTVFTASLALSAVPPPTPGAPALLCHVGPADDRTLYRG